MNPYNVAIVGCPSKMDVEWNSENLEAISKMGFNVVQLNIAWGTVRPDDEPENLEDVVELSEALAKEFPQTVPLRCDPSPERRRQRVADLRHRIAMSKQHKLRNLFNFGAPFNNHLAYGDNQPNCIMDPAVVRRYELLLEQFASDFPGVDDLVVWTYDMDAWLCNEFGQCPRCMGIPLHSRVSEFVNGLAKTWGRLNPDGMVWWEPWELSAGQSFEAFKLLDASRVGLCLHSNIAECTNTMAVDRWLEISTRMAKELKLPVIVEHFLGAPSEEVEPFNHLSFPLVILRALKKIGKLRPNGIKEYYGIVPSSSDVNLRTTSLYFANPEITEEQALAELSAIYGDCAGEMVKFWRLQGEAMELYPWNASWWIRNIGCCDPVHSMRAAFIRGEQAHTPAWESTRRAIYMKTDDLPADPWMLEDVGLQCQIAADRMLETYQVGKSIEKSVPKELRDWVTANVNEVGEWRRKTLSFAYHIRETNLTQIIRQCHNDNLQTPEHVIQELKDILKADIENQGQNEPCASALALLTSDPREFVKKYFSWDDANACETRRFEATCYLRHNVTSR